MAVYNVDGNGENHGDLENNKWMLSSQRGSSIPTHGEESDLQSVKLRRLEAGQAWATNYLFVNLLKLTKKATKSSGEPFHSSSRRDRKTMCSAKSGANLAIRKASKRGQSKGTKRASRIQLTTQYSLQQREAQPVTEIRNAGVSISGKFAGLPVYCCFWGLCCHLRSSLFS
ncbi:hypothetical protein Ancab_014106 [Ancistrocladus abbreviatus]